MEYVDVDSPNITILSSGYNKENYDSIKFDYDKVLNNLSKKDCVVLRDPFVLFVRKHPEYCNMLMKNLECVKISRVKSLSNDGDFMLWDNACKYHYSMDSRYHELLHMASAIADNKNDVLHFGFSYLDLQTGMEIGLGLTEGYTTLLEDRDYYVTNSLPNNNYWMADLFVRKLEMIIGKEKMEELYFCADLEGLIEELRKYLEYEDVLDLINAIDYSILPFRKAKYFADEILVAQEMLRNIIYNNFPDKIEAFEKDLIEFEDDRYYLDSEETDVYINRKLSNA